MSGGVDKLEGFVVHYDDDSWGVLLKVNDKEWKRYGPWPDRDTAQLYCSEAIVRAERIAKRLWKRYAN